MSIISSFYIKKRETELLENYEFWTKVGEDLQERKDESLLERNNTNSELKTCYYQ